MPESCIMSNLKTMQAFTRPKIFIWSTLTMAQSTAKNQVTRQMARSLGMLITSMSTFKIWSRLMKKSMTTHRWQIHPMEAQAIRDLFFYLQFKQKPWKTPKEAIRAHILKSQQWGREREIMSKNFNNHPCVNMKIQIKPRIPFMTPQNNLKIRTLISPPKKEIVI